jgi:hypothetical protein
MVLEAAVIVGINVVALVLHYIGMDRRITRLEERMAILWRRHEVEI